MTSRSHKIGIPSILSTGYDCIESLGYLLKRSDMDHVALFCDEQIYQLFGKMVEEILKDEKIIYEIYKVDMMDICEILSKAFSFSNEVDAYIGLGGGKVIDVTKYMAFLRKRPLISIPTSTSNDGFSSPVASLMVNGKRTTVPAKIPYGIIVDIHIIQNAPKKYIYSGIGDLLSNITALWDWEFEEKEGQDKMEDFAAMISQKAVNSFLNYSFSSVTDDYFLKNLVDSLIMNGIAMEISGSSAPASGSEHLISHALDQIIDKPFLHGIQVGIAAYIMSKVQNNRCDEILKIFEETGFWDYVKTLQIPKEKIRQAIELAPTIKPQRYTALHFKQYNQEAQKVVEADHWLQQILR